MSEKIALVVPAVYTCPHLFGFTASKPVEPVSDIVAQGAVRHDILTSLSDRQHYMPEVSTAGTFDQNTVNTPTGVARFMARNGDQGVETDPRYKQLIPYVIVTWRNKILCYRRPSKNAESRLAGLRSLGFGGHIELADLETVTEARKPNVGTITAADLIMAALGREIEEELHIRVADAAFLGWVSHNDTPVGSVHLGLVFNVDILGTMSFVPSDEIEGAELLSIDDAFAKIEEFEVWSQFVLRFLKANGLQL